MKEVIENGTVFEVSENYPEPPYTKVAKTTPVGEGLPVDPLAAINVKLDAMAVEIAAIKVATKK